MGSFQTICFPLFCSEFSRLFSVIRFALKHSVVGKVGSAHRTNSLEHAAENCFQITAFLHMCHKRMIATSTGYF